MLLEDRAAPSLAEARADLATEWRQADPRTPDEIHRFYERATGIAKDLEAWHATPERANWTEMLVHVAKTSNARAVVDIGCGAGHDLLALQQAGLRNLCGIEPNHRLAFVLLQCDVTVVAHPADAPIEDADLLVCIDVLEHVPNPEDFLERSVGRAKVGALLFEATATHDTGTPLHLKQNRGWQPGRWLEQHGWWLVDHSGRVRVWQRQTETARQTSSLLLCAHRIPPVVNAAIQLTGGGSALWRMQGISGDALIARARSMIVSEWWTSTGDDAFLMVDDDITFTMQDADRAVELCRNGHDIVCGAYPVRGGQHLALRTLPGPDVLSFGPDQAPVEVMYAATGFMAVHRRVIDALVESLPIVNSGEPWFYPLFAEFWVQDAQVDGQLFLSEDWAFCERARRLGFKVWLDPQTRLIHEGRTVPLTVSNMEAMQHAIATA